MFLKKKYNLSKKKKALKNKSIKNKNKNKNKKYGGCQLDAEHQLENIIDPIKQWNSPYEKVPPHDLNGGIYSGEQAKGPWGHIPVTPTTTNYIYNNLKTAEPPPGALITYPGTDRMGNNYQAMPGIENYRNNNYGPFKINCSNSLMNGGKNKETIKKIVKKRMNTIF
jgi:hypothetical protein